MTEILRKNLKAVRDKIFAKVNRSLAAIEDEIKLVKDNQLQLQIQHKTISDQLRDSGVISISDREIITKIFTGLKFYLDPRDISFTPHLALDSIWEESVTLAWLSIIKPKTTIVDVGANFGYYGAIAAQRTGAKDSKIISFEANPKLIPYIKKTLSVNWLNEQSIIENLALSDKEGKVTLNVLKDYIGSSSLHSLEHLNSYMDGRMHLETQERITVAAITLDTYCKNNQIKSVDLIKMDIEGFEDRAYDGMSQIVKSSPNLTLFVEFTNKSYAKPKKFYEKMLNDFGFVYLINPDGTFAAPKNTTYESVAGKLNDWIMLVFSKNKLS